jgi:hypothetical protein
MPGLIHIGVFEAESDIGQTYQQLKPCRTVSASQPQACNPWVLRIKYGPYCTSAEEEKERGEYDSGRRNMTTWTTGFK